MLTKILLVLSLVFVSFSEALAAVPPVWLVEAIICHESTGNPNAVNIAGVTHYPEDQAASIRLIQKATEDSVSYDVGLMQINCYWVNHLDIDPATLLDPATNIELGSWILSNEILRYGLNWVAVGKYHDKDLERGRRYAWKIYTLADPEARMQTEPDGAFTAAHLPVCAQLLDADGGWLRSETVEEPQELVRNYHR